MFLRDQYYSAPEENRLIFLFHRVQVIIRSMETSPSTCQRLGTIESLLERSNGSFYAAFISFFMLFPQFSTCKTWHYTTLPKSKRVHYLPFPCIHMNLWLEQPHFDISCPTKAYWKLVAGSPSQAVCSYICRKMFGNNAVSDPLLNTLICAIRPGLLALMWFLLNSSPVARKCL